MDSTGWRSAEAGDGEARTGRRERGRRERGRRRRRRQAEGERTAGWASSRVTKRRGQRLGRAVGAAVKRHATIVITDTFTGVVAVGVETGTGQDIAVMVSSVVNMKGVTDNDDDAKPAPTTRRWTAAPASGAMSPEATSRAVDGRLARRRSSSSSAAPVPGGVMRGVQRELTEPMAEVRSAAPEARGVASAVVQTPVHGEVRKPVTGEARTDEAKAEPGVLTTSAARRTA